MGFTGVSVAATVTIECTPLPCRVVLIEEGIPGVVPLTGNAVTPIEHGAVGDGVVDDTVAMQAALTQCSTENKICFIAKSKRYRITQPVFAWGDMDLIGEDRRGWILLDFAVPTPFAVNMGISAKQVPERPFTGKIDGVAFKVLGAPSLGRLLTFWRSDGARVSNNYLDSDVYQYSLTQGQNHNDWVNEGAGQKYIRRDITIEDNHVVARDTTFGGEGIGIGLFDGVIIRRNRIHGGGDDPLGIHFCTNVEIYDNVIDSVESRVFIANSTNVHIHHNKISRSASRLNKRWYPGQALIFVGFEIPKVWVGPGVYAPTNIVIEENDLYYPSGARDSSGAAIYLSAPRNVTVRNNRIVNDSPSVEAQGIAMWPVLGIPASAKWQDPDGLDPFDTANVYDVVIEGNILSGAYPQAINRVGDCSFYLGRVIVKGNTARKHASDLTLLDCVPNMVVIDPHDSSDPALLPPPDPPPPPPTEASLNCTEGVEIVDNLLRRWTYTTGGLIRIDGEPPPDRFASGQLFLWANNTIYNQAGGHWYKVVAGDFLVDFGPTKPVCP